MQASLVVIVGQPFATDERGGYGGGDGGGYGGGKAGGEAGI